jgi:hypothetical protein
MPAAGFALDLDHLAWARRVAGCVDESAVRTLVVGEGARSLAAALRDRGVTAAACDSADPRAYAAAWRYSALISREGRTITLEHLDTGARSCDAPVDSGDVAVATWAELLLAGRAPPG